MSFLKSGSLFRTVFMFFAVVLLTATTHAQVTRFVVTRAGGNNKVGSATIQAGTTFAVKITAVDATGATVTNYNQKVTISLPEPRLTNAFWYTKTVALANGVLDNVSITPKHGGTADRRIAVTDGNIATYDAAQRKGDANGLFSISPARFEVRLSGADSYSISTYTLLTGQETYVRIRAVNSDGTTDETYTGLVSMSSNGNTFSPVFDFFDGSTNGVVDDVIIDWTTTASNDTITVTDGIVTTSNPSVAGGASGFFNVIAPATGAPQVGSPDHSPYTGSFATGNIAASGRVKISAIAATNALYPGQSVGISFTATNPHSGTAAAQNVPAILSQPVPGPMDFLINVIDGSGVIVTSNIVRYAGSIAGDITADRSVTLKGIVVIPQNVSPGALRIEVSAGLVGDTGAGAATLLGQPDLAITRFDYAPGQYRGGDALRFDMAWTNILVTIGAQYNSKVPVDAAYRVEIHLSANSTFGDNDDILVWQGTAQGNSWIDPHNTNILLNELLGGQSVSISDSFLLPKNVPGTFYLMAKVNSAGGRISISDTSANFASGFISTTGSSVLTEVIGPKIGTVLYPGNNVWLAAESAKISLLPDKSPDTSRISLPPSNPQLGAIIESQGLSDQPSINQNGRFTAFQSLGAMSTTGAAGTTYNVYLCDSLLNSTTLLSPAANTTQANGSSIHPRINSDARYVVYQSAASNLVNGDTNGYIDIFLRDTFKNTTVRINSSSAFQSNQDSSLPDISGDGRFIVFESNASNIPVVDAVAKLPIPNPNPFKLRQIFIYDRDSDANGIFDEAGKTTYIMVSRDSSVGGKAGNANSNTPRISRDGNFVVFSTTASNLISTATPFSQVVRWRRANGALATVSATPSSTQLADGDTAYPVINSTGQYVVFASRAHNLTTNPSDEGIPHLFRVALNTSGVVNEAVRINGYVGASATATIDTASGTIFAINLTNAGSGYTSAPGVSIKGGGGTGAYATANFDSFTGKVTGITLIRPGSGYTSVPTVTVGTIGVIEPGDLPFSQFLDLGSFEPAISDDGKTVTYVSESVNLLPPVAVHHIDRTTYQSTAVQNYEDRDDAADVYVSDLTNPLRPVNNRVSVSKFGYEATTTDVSGLATSQIVQSRSPAISGDGGYIAFTSDAKGHNGLIFDYTNFDYLANNSVKDIYIYNAKRSLPTIVTDLPAVALNLTAALSVSANLDLPLAATITANPRPIAQVEFYADGLLVDTVTAPTVVGSGQYAGTFKVSTLNIAAIRTFTVVAVAVDSLGARSLESNATLVTVNPVIGKLPFVALTNPNAAISVSNVSQLLVQANSSDADGSITAVAFYLDGLLVATGSPDGVFNYQGSFSTSGFVPGVHTLTAQARDNSGNTVISAPIALSIAPATSSAPTAVLGALPTTLAAGLNIPVKGTGTPASGQKIATIKIYSNGLLVASLNNAPNGVFSGDPRNDFIAATAGSIDLSFTFTPDTPNTTYNLYVVVTDFGGNTVTSATKSVAVGATAPASAKDTVEKVYQSLFLRSATSSELKSAISLYGNNLTAAQIAALAVQSSEFRDNGGEIILSYLAAWGRYPSYDEYSALLTQRALGGTDVDFVADIFASPEYQALYGDR